MSWNNICLNTTNLNSNSAETSHHLCICLIDIQKKQYDKIPNSS